MRKALVFAALALFAAQGLALEPKQAELEHNGWFRYTNQSTSFGITNPDVSRFALERGYIRLSYQWSSQFFTKFTLDFFSSDKYAEGSTVRLKEGYADLALPLKDFNLTAGLQKHYFGLIYSWDYTHPDKSLADIQGIAASADYGLTVNGFLPGGLGELQLGLYNGEGYKYAGKYVNKSPELLANLRLTPFAGVMAGVSVFRNAEDHVAYKNDVAAGKLSTDRKKWLLPDTVNKGRMGLAPVVKFAFGPVSLTGEYIIYNYTREFGYYTADSTTGKIVDSTRLVSEKRYAQSGLDLIPLVSLAKRKFDVYARITTWERKEDGTRNDAKSSLSYGGGFNYHFIRREKGKPGLALQVAWTRNQTKAEGAKPTDTFIAQFRFEWAQIVPEFIAQ
ncbi:MAG: hypothetical protein ABIL25_01265 [candidate division WOR-3 bacterium]